MPEDQLSAASGTTEATPASASQVQSLFQIMWAFGLITHLWNHSGGQFETVTGTVAFLAGVGAVVRFRDGRWLVVLALAQLADVAWQAPGSPNHWNLAAIVNIALILTWLMRRTTIGLVVAAAPTLRVVTIIAYGAAAAAKYNDTFFDTTNSCAVFLADIATLTLSGMMPSLAWGHILLSVVAETGVAVGLLVPRLRRYGALLGICFHVLVSFSPAMRVADFTAILVALFVLFLPANQVHALLSELRARARFVKTIPTWHAVGFIVLCGGLLGYVSSFSSLTVLWAGATLYGSVVVIAAWRSMSRGGERPSVRPRSATAVIPIALVLALAASPYLGLRTTGVFTMFSNLRTEGAGTNHFFLPSFHVVSWQNDLVELVDASDEPFVTWVEEGQAFPELGLRLITSADADLVVSGTLDGQPVHYGPAGSVDEVGRDTPNWLVRRLVTFRSVPASGDPVCSD